MELKLREGRPQDATACGTIAYEAFKKIAEEHNFPPDFPSAAVATDVVTFLLRNPGYYRVVAELDSRIVGSNFMDERNPIAGIGPITVDPAAQNRAIGRRLMLAAMERAAARKFPGVRLVQAAYHRRSLSLYTKLGFDSREPLSTFQGPALNISIPGCTVRPAQASDLDECARLCVRVHGHDRTGEMRDALRPGYAAVVERAGRITGYTSAIAFFGHSIGDQRRSAGADRRGAIVRRPGLPRADAQQRSHALVPQQRAAYRPADDPDDHRALQRARRGLAAVRNLLSAAHQGAVPPTCPG